VLLQFVLPNTLFSIIFLLVGVLSYNIILLLKQKKGDILMIKFRDKDELEKEVASISFLVDGVEHQRMLKQCSADPFIHWGKNRSVLIISDRCPGRARGLQTYLEERTELGEVTCLSSLVQARKHINHHKVDILIFAGYQKNARNYRIRELLPNKDAYTVMYAMLDEHIEMVCLQYHIKYSFSSWKPVRAFVGYLKERG
jgi:hypothetical protein